jgi:uncharacterized damage-inducible protein DinB
VERTDPPLYGDERAQLEAWLDFHRATVHRKCAGLAEPDAWRTPLPSSPVMSLAGLVCHLYWVERNWFERILGGVDVPLPWLVRRDGEFEPLGDGTLAAALAHYAQACESSRGFARGVDLEYRAHHPRTGEDIQLRWIYLHMIEETARHNGHFDAMRELIDGTTGE